VTTSVVATIKPWHISAFKQKILPDFSDWVMLNEPEQLSLTQLEVIQPRYIFFPHWSWRVLNEIIERYECICFHSSDAPYGRGGSPIQNLIARGHQQTQISALRMVEELDAGPVYR